MYLKLKHRQKGSALTMAVFIIVVLGLLTTVLIRLLAGSSEATVTEVYGQRALNAAGSGADLYLAELFSDSSINCPDESLSSSPTTTYPLEYCKAEVRCRKLDLSAVNNTIHYRILSSGVCGVAGEIYSREIIVEATDDVN